MYYCEKSTIRIKPLFLLLIYFLPAPCILGQRADTIPKKQNKVLKELIQAISHDTVQVDRMEVLRRNDAKYRPFSGAVIRQINIVRIPFGKTFPDSSTHSSNTLINLANTFHHITSIKTIRNNLFFNEKDTVNPYLFADNERYLRELSYLRDADFKVKPISGTDSVDITVIVKDLFSLGGSINSLGLNTSDVEMREDNFHGTGNAGVIYATYDKDRKKNFAFGGEIVRRNIDGLFLNQTIGYRSYYNSIRSPKQENYFYYNLSKPLLNRFMKFTYEFDASYHATSNRYDSDSVYLSDHKYNYFQLEGWLGFNVNGQNFSPADESRRLRFLSGARVIVQKFNHKPGIYQKNYNWQFADLSGILASFTFYRQNFFKTQFVYGFGINEDIPEGLLFSFTSGFTIKENLSRPFIGLNFQQYGFMKNQNYIDYTLRFEGYLNHKRIEDINMLAAINYFDRLKSLSAKWKQRFFLSLSASRQINAVLNEPLFINSKFAMPEYGSDYTGGDARITAKAESAFFSPWSLMAFRFAPLLSYNLTAFSPFHDHLKLYSAIGAGIRTRNESLIFGTIELKGNYFPQRNFYNEKFNIELSTNIAFKLNTQFLRKPNFIEIN